MIAADNGTTKAVMKKMTPSRRAISSSKRRCLTRLFVVTILLALAGIVVAIVFGVVFHQQHSPSPANGSSNNVGQNITPPLTDPSNRTSKPPTAVPTVSPIQASTSNPTTTVAAVSLKPSLRPTVLPSSLPTFTSTQTTNSSDLPSFSFYAMGDVPYESWQDAVLVRQLEEITQNRSENSVFTVHVGDIMKWQLTDCRESAYQKVHNILSNGSLPTLVIAGDNDSDDCPDPFEAWAYFKRYFVPFEDNWTNRLPPGVPLLNVTRYTQRPELFVFVHNDILFVSTNLMNDLPDNSDTEAMAEWDSRMQDNIDWITMNLKEQVAQRTLRAVFIFGHAVRADDTRNYIEDVVTLFQDQGLKSLPVMYVHGDGHKFVIDAGYGERNEFPGYIDLQVDQGAFADPLLIEIAPVVNGQMVPLTKETNMQHLFGDGLIRVDRRKGKY